MWERIIKQCLQVEKRLYRGVYLLVIVRENN